MMNVDLKSDSCADMSVLYCNEKSVLYTPEKCEPLAAFNGGESHSQSTPYSASRNTDTATNSDSVKALEDPILESEITLQNLIQKCRTKKMYSGYVTKDINFQMREILLRWMYEVNGEYKFSDAVFQLAATYLDSYLGVAAISMGQLQLLACACLLVASKMRHCMTADPEMLSHLTEDCFSPAEISAFELVLLSKLHWDVSLVVPSDLFAPIFRLAGLSHVRNIGTNAQTFLSAATLYPQMMRYNSAEVAYGVVYTVLQYYRVSDEALHRFLDFAMESMNMSEAYLQSIVDAVWSNMSEELSKESPQEQQSSNIRNEPVPANYNYKDNGRRSPTEEMSSGYNSSTSITSSPMSPYPGVGSNPCIGLRKIHSPRINHISDSPRDRLSSIVDGDMCVDFVGNSPRCTADGSLDSSVDSGMYSVLGELSPLSAVGKEALGSLSPDDIMDICLE